ncbi:hypothetical protein VKT23_019493 [Stygiomarasmius scandens]|uniref:Uncharacterized protein n=1 Tax=Marasmiellus scandens TaxID=2682957 RepID=A0ABR1INQ7_9AGAR
MQTYLNQFSLLPSSSEEFMGSITSRLHVVALGLALALSLFINLMAIFEQLRLSSPSTRSYSYLQNDHPRELPLNLRPVNLVFADDPDHYGMEGARAVSEWNALHPEGQGSVYLGPPDRPPLQVALFHQLHCLHHIRSVIVNGDYNPARTSHCMLYLLQSLLCTADTTLEEGGSGTVTPEGDIIVPPNNKTHTCRDWTQVYEFTEKNREGWTTEQIELEAKLSQGTLLADIVV